MTGDAARRNQADLIGKRIWKVDPEPNGLIELQHHGFNVRQSGRQFRLGLVHGYTGCAFQSIPITDSV
jgi:hypothetical protein